MGVGFDEPEVNAGWAEEEGFLFELWTDDEKSLALYYGAVQGERQTYPDRISRLLDADGYVLLQYDDVATGTHPARVLEDAQALLGP